jgi:RNA polymerase sigma factor FliA
LEDDVDDLAVQYKRYAEYVVSKIARTQGISPEIQEDLLGAAYLALVESAEKFEPEKARHFICYASYRIKGAIFSELYQLRRQKRSQIRSKVKIQAAYNSIRNLEGIPEGLEGVLEAAASAAISYSLISSDGNQDMLEKVANEEQDNSEEILLKKQMYFKLRESMQILSEQEQYIIRSYYFEEKGYDEIAKGFRDLGYTSGSSPVHKSWICRLHGKVLVKLKKHLAQKEEFKK